MAQRAMEGEALGLDGAGIEALRADIAAWRKPQNMLVQTNRAGGALRFRFRLSSVNTTVACQVM